jgi:hypothetical protein
VLWTPTLLIRTHDIFVTTFHYPGGIRSHVSCVLRILLWRTWYHYYLDQFEHVIYFLLFDAKLSNLLFGCILSFIYLNTKKLSNLMSSFIYVLMYSKNHPLNSAEIQFMSLPGVLSSSQFIVAEKCKEFQFPSGSLFHWQTSLCAWAVIYFLVTLNRLCCPKEICPDKVDPHGYRVARFVW